jgi:hypothetical protein
MPRSFASLATLAALGAAVPMSGSAQSAMRPVAAGDKVYAERKAPEALRHYLEALAADSTNVAALTRASRTEAELAEFDPDTTRRLTLLESAERHARAAIARAPQDAEAHFALAQALGRHALLLPVTDRLPYAVEIHKEAAACLDLAPKHPGCLHVLALWNAEYMPLGYFSRELANTMTGGTLFVNASWVEAERKLLAAIAVEPRRAIHHLDLARIYLDEGKKAEARAELQAVLDAPVKDVNDPHYREEAKKLLEAM